jgi:DNA polymerase III subunit alpha
VRGRVSRRDDGMNLHAQSAFTPDLGSLDESGSLVLVMPERRASEDVIGELLQTLQRHGGDTEVSLKLHSGSVAKVFEVPHTVRITPDLYGELKGLLGPQCLG